MFWPGTSLGRRRSSDSLPSRARRVRPPPQSDKIPSPVDSSEASQAVRRRAAPFPRQDCGSSNHFITSYSGSRQCCHCSCAENARSGWCVWCGCLMLVVGASVALGADRRIIYKVIISRIIYRMFISTLCIYISNGLQK
jgi:hypothetical protein